uniref:Chitin-binding type-4 domain-containing protein n=1 Tax=Globisporangium ultimum (strain ATCC 200006 / CBS 805.95 / DAOM BR144) TaxID=431595 RepID=K3W977_GLOUD
MVSAAFFSAVAVAVASMAASVNAHGFLVDPPPDFLPGIDITAYTSTIIGTSLYPDGIFNTYPEGNVNSFVAHFKNDTRYKNIRDMIVKEQKVISGASEDCGYTDITKSKHKINGSSVYWGRNDAANREGFVDSHEGPCEVWCDDNMVQTNMNCVRAYPNKPGHAAEVPIDVAKCAGAKKLTFYWIAMHGNEWQVYTDCVALASGSGSDSASSASNSSKTPASTTAAPAASTPAPDTTAPVDADADEEETPAPAASSADDEYPDETASSSAADSASAGDDAVETPAPAADDEYPEEIPAPTTATPATTTSAPTPSATKKCTAKSARKLMRGN